MEIEVVGKEKDFEPQCGDIYKGEYTDYYILVKTGDGYIFAKIGTSFKWSYPRETEQIAFETLDNVVIGKNYFPADSTKLTIEYLG